MHFLGLHGLLLAFKFSGGAKKFAFGIQLDKKKKAFVSLIGIHCSVWRVYVCSKMALHNRIEMLSSRDVLSIISIVWNAFLDKLRRNLSRGVVFFLCCRFNLFFTEIEQIMILLFSFRLQMATLFMLNQNQRKYSRGIIFFYYIILYLVSNAIETQN